MSLGPTEKPKPKLADEWSTVSTNAEEDQVPASRVPPKAPFVIVGCADCTTKTPEVDILESTEPATVNVTELAAVEHLK